MHCSHYGFFISFKFLDKMDVAILHEEFVEGNALGHQVIFNLYHMSLCLFVAFFEDTYYEDENCNVLI